MLLFFRNFGATAFHPTDKKVNDHIFLNPGFYVIVNPKNDSCNGTIFVGLLRTTFEL